MININPMVVLLKEFPTLKLINLGYFHNYEQLRAAMDSLSEPMRLNPPVDNCKYALQCSRLEAHPFPNAPRVYPNKNMIEIDPVTLEPTSKSLLVYPISCMTAQG